MEKKNFIRIEEDFICENCGYKVKGSGYTNHCPKCLFSKHVDKVPGDRANACKGLMAPVGVELKNSEYDIIYKCLKCGERKVNRTSDGDNFDQIIKLSLNYRV